MEVLWWLLIGLLAAWVAKLLVPGREPGGFLATLALGVIGSVVGGWIWRAIWGPANYWGSFLVAFAGSVIVLFIYHAVVNRRRI